MPSRQGPRRLRERCAVRDIEPSELPDNVRKEGGRYRTALKARQVEDGEKKEKTAHERLTWHWSRVGTMRDPDRSGNRHVANSSKSGKPYPTHKSALMCLNTWCATFLVPGNILFDTNHHCIVLLMAKLTFLRNL